MSFCHLLIYLFYLSVLFILLYFFLFLQKHIFLRRNQNKKIKQLQSSPDQTLFVQSDLGPNCMLMLSVGNNNSKKYP